MPGETIVLILQILAVVISAAGLALAIFKAATIQSTTTASHVGLSIAQLLGEDPDIPTLAAFVSVSNEVLASDTIVSSGLAGLIDLTLIGLGFWILTGNAKIGETAVKPVWGLIFLLTGLFFFTRPKKRKLTTYAN